MKRGGTIDKYMGDAIMAFWNAPLDDPNHAENAARATLAMISDLARLNADWRAEAKAENRPFHQVRIGVGLNTGPICVGNVGSDLRFDYSVIGDDVNLASRLESQCKTYGTSIIIGSNTRSRLNGFAAVELDLLRVKGRERPERIYTLLGDETTGKEPWFKQLDELQTALLAAYRTQDWDRAEELIAAARKLANGQLDPVYDLYVARIAEYRFQPPPNDWDGITRATEK
jgi:adenylate cyclase